MLGAFFATVVNVVVTALFAASFAVVAMSSPARRKALWFAASYAAGVLTPVSELMVQLTPMPELFRLTSYVSFLAALLIMAAALSVFFGRSPPWRTIVAIFVVAMVGRWLLWEAPRGTLFYEMTYQIPFALASFVSCLVVLQAAGRQASTVVLAAMFGIIAVHFLLKPFLAVAYGSTGPLTTYMASTYALLSQGITGILLTATGLVVLLAVGHGVVADTRLASETDPLTGLANRRGLDAAGERALANARRFGLPLSLVLFDIDHFKQINDTYGHAVGDRALQQFSALLREATPDGVILARVGGEEFVMLLERVTIEGARLNAEAVRTALTAATLPGLPRLTTSAGVSGVSPKKGLADAMRQADHALYRAKRSGRDKVCVMQDREHDDHAAGPAPRAARL